MCATIKRLMIQIVPLVAIVVLIPPAVRADGDTTTDKTLSPYFFVKAENTGVELMPLLSTTAQVGIAGVIADVRVTQVYQNRGQVPIEAVYVFPGSTRAAVYGMTMTVGNRVRVAKIKERQAAKQQYEQAKSEGKSASLLEQQRPNVFQMNVANIMPGDEIKVELSYTELLIPDEGVYEFMYPTVVAPRYSNQPAHSAAKTDKWVSNPYLRKGVRSNAKFDLNVSLNAGLPIQEISSSSHKVEVEYQRENTASVGLDPAEHCPGDRDYILHYRLQGGEIESGMLLYEGEKENFFLLMMQPPKVVYPAEMPPREYIFIVDVSGSMNGFPLDTSKALLKDLIGGLGPEDRFNVLLFAAGSSVLAEESLPGTAANIEAAIRMIEHQRGGGGTQILPALKQAFALPNAEGVSRTIVIATDGLVHVEKEAFEFIRNNLGTANVFPFGIGRSVNRFLLEGMARAGSGESFIVTDEQDAWHTAGQFRRYIKSPVLTDIEVEFEDFIAYDVEPPSVPDILSERPVVLFGKWRGKLEGEISIAGVSGDDTYSKSFDLEDAHSSETNRALRYLWARHRIQKLGDYHQVSPSSEQKMEITNLGLDYNLLTEFTSFIAIDDVVRNTEGHPQKVKQPHPMPKGLNNTAVGGSVPTVPEPETWMLIGVLGLMLIATACRRRRELEAILSSIRRG